MSKLKTLSVHCGRRDAHSDCKGEYPEFICSCEECHGSYCAVCESTRFNCTCDTTEEAETPTESSFCKECTNDFVEGATKQCVQQPDYCINCCYNATGESHWVCAGCETHYAKVSEGDPNPNSRCDDCRYEEDEECFCEVWMRDQQDDPKEGFSFDIDDVYLDSDGEVVVEFIAVCDDCGRHVHVHFSDWLQSNQLTCE